MTATKGTEAKVGECPSCPSCIFLYLRVYGGRRQVTQDAHGIYRVLSVRFLVLSWYVSCIILSVKTATFRRLMLEIRHWHAPVQPKLIALHFATLFVFRVSFLQVEDSSGRSAASSEEDGNGDGNDNDAEADLPLVDFGAVVAGKERFDVCRLFLASLQLVGHGHCHGCRGGEW